MRYALYILGRAERDIKRLKKNRPELVATVVRQIRELSENPRPFGYEPLEDQKDVFRVHSEDDKYRIIYSIQARLRAVMVVTIRKRNEGAYRNIARGNLSEIIEQITLKFNNAVQSAMFLARRMNIEWITGLESNHIRDLCIGIQAIKEGRSTLSATAEQGRTRARVNEGIETIVSDLRRLTQQM